MTRFNDETRFLIDFNVHAVASALGLPIPDEATALIYGITPADLAAYQAEIDGELRQSAMPFRDHAGVMALAGLAGAGGRILCLGDSITTYRRSYARMLPHLLAGVEVVNGGFSGYTSTHGLELTYTQFLAMQPGLVTISYGVNDCKQFDGSAVRPLVSAKEYAENLARIVQAFQKHTAAQVVVLTPTQVVEAVVNTNPAIQAMNLTWNNTLLAEYAALALQVAAQAGVRAVDLRGTLGNPPDAALYCADGLHPNAAGQVRMLRQLLQTLQA